MYKTIHLYELHDNNKIVGHFRSKCELRGISVVIPFQYQSGRKKLIKTVIIPIIYFRADDNSVCKALNVTNISKKIIKIIDSI